MVSYKKLYEDQVKFVQKEWKSDFKCPKCGEIILESMTGVVCSRDGCTFELSTSELFEIVALYRNYEEIEKEND